MIERITEIQNGDYWVPFTIYQCDHCGCELPESAPRVDDEHKNYCGDCAFKLGLITEKELLQDFYFWLDIPGLRAVVHEGKVYVDQGKFFWERTSRDRECSSYKEWREAVYQRDDYTCQKCGQRGGKLNAHHIKSYAKYPDLRLDINNGITLCVDCHKITHRKKKEG